MNLKVLSVVCCPSCQGDLGVLDNDGCRDIIEEGGVRCSCCGTIYDIKASILILHPSEQESPQNAERKIRDGLASEYGDASISKILDRVSRHHYVPVMKKVCKSFAGRLPEQQWILDIGTGWGWHWLGVNRPNIVAIDFSFDSLLVARRLLSSQLDRNVHLICADVAQLPVKDGAVDGIWSVQVLQHLPEPALEQCMSLCSTALKAEGAVEVYWLNWPLLGRSIRMLLGRHVDKEAADPYYLRYITGSELRNLIGGYFEREITVGYNELVFHPDLRVIHRLPFAWLDQWLGRVPFLNRALARQVVVKVRGV